MSHYSIEFKIPIYCCSFIDSNQIILGGGGGTTKSGITNQMIIIKLDSSTKSSSLLNQFNLEKGEDVPMSLHFDKRANQLICGINSPLLSSNPAQNLHLRIFSLDQKHQLKSKSAQRVLSYTSEDNYQRITCLSDQSPRLLAVGGTNNQLELVNYPTLKPAFQTIWCDKDDHKSQLLAVDFHPDESQFLVATSSNIKLYLTRQNTQPSTSPSKRKNSQGLKNKMLSPNLIRQIDPPLTGSEFNSSFRNAKYGRGNNSKTIYTIINQLPNNLRSRKKSTIWNKSSDQKKAILITWNLEDGRQVRSKTISNKPITSFDISPSGSYLAFSSSDLSIGILDASSLRSLLSILHAHEFPVTSIKFSPDENRVVSCSADMTIRVIELDKSFQKRSSKNLIFLISLLILLICLMIKFFS